MLRLLSPLSTTNTISSSDKWLENAFPTLQDVSLPCQLIILLAKSFILWCNLICFKLKNNVKPVPLRFHEKVLSTQLFSSISFCRLIELPEYRDFWFGLRLRLSWLCVEGGQHASASTSPAPLTRKMVPPTVWFFFHFCQRSVWQTTELCHYRSPHVICPDSTTPWQLLYRFRDVLKLGTVKPLLGLLWFPVSFRIIPPFSAKKIIGILKAFFRTVSHFARVDLLKWENVSRN